MTKNGQKTTKSANSRFQSCYDSVRWLAVQIHNRPSLYNWWIPMTSVGVPGGSSHSYNDGVHIFILLVLSIIFNSLKHYSSLQYHCRRSCKISFDTNFQNLNLLFLQIENWAFLSKIRSKTRFNLQSGGRWNNTFKPSFWLLIEINFVHFWKEVSSNVEEWPVQKWTKFISIKSQKMG